MNPFTAPVVIQATPAINPNIPVAITGATQFLNAARPGNSTYTQTLGNGVASCRIAPTPGTRGKGFPGGAAPASTFTLTVHGGGAVQVLRASGPGAGYGAGANPYPLPSGGAPPRGGGARGGPHICGGGAAIFHGVVAIDGDLVVWGKIYAPGDTHPPQTFRGNSAATTGELQDVAYYHGTASTTSIPYYEGLEAVTGGATTAVLTYISDVSVTASFDPDTCQVAVTATTTTATAAVVVGSAAIVSGLTWASSGTVSVLAAITASSSAGTNPQIVMVAGS